MSYRESRYNYYVEEQNNYILFNTYTNAFIELEFNKVDVKNEKLKFDEFSDSEISVLKENGIIIDNDFDELEMIKYNEMYQKFNKEKISYTIAPTLDCNANCSYCFQPIKNKIMDGNVADAIIAQLDSDFSDETKYFSVAWFGGEPLLEKSLTKISSLSKKIIDLCSKKNIEYNAMVVTNGSLLNEKILKDLIEKHVVAIQITLDGTRDIHNEVKNVEVFDKVINSIKLINKTDINLSLRINLSNDNYTNIKELIEFLSKTTDISKTGIYFAQVQCVNKLSCKNDYSAFLSDKKYAQIELELTKFAIDKGFYFSFPEYNSALCSATNNSDRLIGPDGKQYMCWNGIYDEEFFNQLPENKHVYNHHFLKYQNYYSFNDEKCTNCKLYPVCKGGCPNMKLKGENSCPPLKHNFNDLIKLFYKSNY